MGMVVLGSALIAKSNKREVMWVCPEAVYAAEAFIERIKLRFGYLDRAKAELTHQVFVVMAQRDMPASGLPVAQRNMVNQPDTGQIIQNPVNGRRLYATRALQYMVDDHPRVHEWLVTCHQGADHGSSGKGQPQPGFPDSLNQQFFGEDDIVRHAFGSL